MSIQDDYLDPDRHLWPAEEPEGEEQQNVLYTPEEVRDILKVSVERVQHFTKSGELGCVRISKTCIRYSSQQIDDFIKSKTMKAGKIDG